MEKSRKGGSQKSSGKHFSWRYFDSRMGSGHHPHPRSQTIGSLTSDGPFRYYYSLLFRSLFAKHVKNYPHIPFRGDVHAVAQCQLTLILVVLL